MRRDILKTTGFRTAAVTIGVLSLSILLLGLFFIVIVRESMIRELEFRIEQEIDVLLHDYEDDGLDELRHDIRERADSGKSNRLYYFLENSEGKVIFDEVSSLPKPEGWHRLDGSGAASSTGEQHLLLRTKELEDGYVLAVGASLNNFREIQLIFLKALLSAILLTFGLGGVGGYYLSRRFLARIERINLAAEKIGDGDFGHRLERDYSGDDIDQLVATMNQMLNRIEQLVSSVKRVSTHVAHELRTPIGHLQQDLRRCLDSELTDEQRRKVITACLSTTKEILDIFAGLLRIAELEAGELKSRFASFSLSEQLDYLVEVYRPIAEDQHQEIKASIASGVQYYGDRRLLSQLLSNLIENALQHAGESSEISVTLEVENRDVVVCVSDTGPGMTPEGRTQALKKILQLDSSEKTSVSRGIGFILIGAILRLHQAEIEVLDNNPGLLIRITFPSTEERHEREIAEF